ncbi:MAG: hypothetical protein H0X30_16475 [Anaerolineae bacterium]|nr:hypothetical protein [Anaerolineae bacterium]
MSFTVSVEAGYASKLATHLPTIHGGQAVFAFLSGLQYYCEVDDDLDSELNHTWREWFKHLQTHIEQPLCEVFQPLADCMWGDGGGLGGDFREDEYEWYLKRNSEAPMKMSEAEFQQFIQLGELYWSPIDAVIANVKLLIELFKTLKLSEVEGLYAAEHMIPDFEALDETLGIFKYYGYRTIRLNFS